MSPSLRFDTGRLDAVVETLDRVAGDMQAEWDRLEHEVAALRGSWSGEAQAAFDEAQRRWGESMRELRGILNACARVGAHGSTTYAAAEKAASALWR